MFTFNKKEQLMSKVRQEISFDVAQEKEGSTKETTDTGKVNSIKRVGQCS